MNAKLSAPAALAGWLSALAVRGWTPAALVWLAAAAMLAAVAAPAGAAAQTISGTLREAITAAPIGGGFVSLLDDEGEAVNADFTGPGGTFSLVAPSPGEYRIRVERIGFGDWTSEPYSLAAGQQLALVVDVSPEPVELSGLRVEIASSCVDDPAQAREVATVWDEARKALKTAVWAEQRGELRFTLGEFERTLDPSSLAVTDEKRGTRRNVPLPPFESAPVGQLMSSGYAEVGGDTTVYYAPDATVLLSDQFREAHCFGLRRADTDGEAMLGITFDPHGARSRVEIEGTIWIDQASAELREVELVYRNVPLPRGADRQLIGANLVFDRLPSGPFYVRDWWIRFPVSGMEARLASSSSSDARPVLVAYRQVGGSVTESFVRGVSFGAGDGVLAGTVFDSASGGPLVGADVILRSWDDAANFLPPPDAARAPLAVASDESGAFRVDGLPDGSYALRVSHPRLAAAGARANEIRVVVDGERSAQLELWTPSAETIYARVCRDASPAGENAGAAIGFARDAASGRHLSGVEVVAGWGESPDAGTSGAVSGEDGRFAVCGLPVGETIRLRVASSAGETAFEQSGRVVWQDLLVDDR